MFDDKCPKCKGELKCLSGESAHPDNWYCKDETGCGWQAWDSSPHETKGKRMKHLIPNSTRGQKMKKFTIHGKQGEDTIGGSVSEGNFLLSCCLPDDGQKSLDQLEVGEFYTGTASLSGDEYTVSVLREE